jgi:HK97 family phage portal protein
VRRIDGSLRYIYTLSKPDSQGKTEHVLYEDQVLHIRGLGFDGIMGYSPIAIARQAVSLGLATEEFGGTFFGNGATPGGVLEHPGIMDDTSYERLKNSWEARHKGLENSSRVAILEEGVKYHQIGIPMDDAQFLETRRFQKEEIAMVFRVPPHMLADLEKATFSNIEQQGLSFIVNSMLPWFVRWEQRVSLSLLLPRERRQYFAQFLVDALQRGDIKTRYDAYAVGRQWGWLSINDVRELENMNPISGGDEYLLPLNMVPLGKEPPPAPAASARSLPCTCGGNHDVEERDLVERRASAINRRHKAIRTHWPLYRDVAARVLRREANDVRNQAKKLMQRSLADFYNWLDDYYAEHSQFTTRQFAPLAKSYGALVASAAQEEIGAPDEGITDDLQRWINSYLASFGTRMAEISKSRIKGALERAQEENLDPVETLDQELSGWDQTRADDTANWESVRFNNGLAVTAFIANNIIKLRWATFGESTCPYCRSLAGKVVGVSDFFLQGGEEFNPDGADRPLTVTGNVRHAPAHDGCDCLTVAAL